MSEKVLAALSKVIDPELRKPITELGMVGEIAESSDTVSVEIKLTIVGCPAAQKIEREVNEALGAVFPNVSVAMSTMTAEERSALKEKLRGGKPLRHNPFAEPNSLTQVIFVGSGKGGVGKSTITANLAVALATLGYEVGLLDADIFGFSIPGQLGITEKPTKVDELMLPPIGHGVKVISIGMFVENNAPVAWRGPMLHRAIEQFLTDVYWGALDFLLVDLPPGTGDIAISLGQLLPGAKSLVVTTPQAAAAAVAERSGAIGLQTGGSILGVVENMAYLETPEGRNEIFGSGGGKAVAARLSEISGQNVELLASLALDPAIRAGSDIGKPVVLEEASKASQEILELAQRLVKTPRGLIGKPLGIQPV
jgi:ATP-binding protein involved in chromosome partitioning